MCLWIGPPAWVKKEVNACTMEKVFFLQSLPLAFWEAIGLREPCTVTSRPQRAAPCLGRHVLSRRSIATTWVGRVERGSARRTVSRKATSAPSMSSKPTCGMSSSCIDKLGSDSTSVHLCDVSVVKRHWILLFLPWNVRVSPTPDGVREAHTTVHVPAMDSYGDHGASEQHSVLLPFSPHKLRIPDELAGHIDAAAGGSRPTALLVGSSGGKVWRVKVGRDGGGALLGRGWPEFAAAHGVGAGWLLVLRHHGGGVLTVKVFDASRCLRNYGAPPAVIAARSSKDTSRRPQFISVLQPDFKEKMLIPAKFVQHYISKEHMNAQMAVILSPLGKFWRIELEVNRLDVFFTGGWSEFLAFHGIIEGNALLLRYEGNMVFTVKVFGLDGRQIESKHKDTRIQQTLPDTEKQQESPSASGKKRKSKNERSSSEGWKRPKGSMTSLNKSSSQKKSVYEIGPPSWIKKEINKNTLENNLSLATTFCDAIGLRKPCAITLKTSMNSNSSWQVGGLPHKNSSWQIRSGWKKFCQENGLKVGDVCTFNVIETTLWHVIIARQ